MKIFSGDRWLHSLLLLTSMVVGAGLRFMFLDSKPPWTDEFSTLVFSLGHSFRTIPLDSPITLDTLLEPLKPNTQATVSDVTTYLMSESTHPPTYFVLAHEWMKLFPSSAGLVDLWVARALPACLGVLSIPAAFGLGWLAFRSRLMGQLAAMLMATSPFGIFLAQEARHYTLAILLVMASLACLAIAIFHLYQRTPIPLWLCLLWIGINSLGISVHYFLSLTLISEGMALLGIWLLDFNAWSRRKPTMTLLPANQGRLAGVMIGTAVGGLVWLPAWQQSYGSELTQWIYSDSSSILSYLNPIFQLIAAWVTMLSLLPVEADLLPIILIAGVIMIAFFVWLLPILIDGLKAHFHHPQYRQAVLGLGGFIGGAIALFFILTYGLGTDLTRGARYNFVYFPAVIVMLGASLAISWNRSTADEDIVQSFAWADLWHHPGKRTVVLVGIMGLLSGLTVVFNLGYQKYYRPDLLASIIQQTSQVPVLIATTHKTHVHTGEMMGVAREFKLASSPTQDPTFLLAHYENDPQTSTDALHGAIATAARPLDVWLVNFHALNSLASQGCLPDPQVDAGVDGYRYQLFHCQ